MGNQSAKRHPERVRVPVLAEICISKPSWLDRVKVDKKRGEKRLQLQLQTRETIFYVLLGSVHGFYVFSIHLFNLPFTAHKWRRAPNPPRSKLSSSQVAKLPTCPLLPPGQSQWRILFFTSWLGSDSDSLHFLLMRAWHVGIIVKLKLLIKTSQWRTLNALCLT